MTGAAGDAMDVTAIVAVASAQRKLLPRADIHDDGWTFWELRTLNMHRVVGLLTEHRRFSDVRDLEGEIRGSIARDFHRSWWRGLAYGVIAQVAPVSWVPDDLTVLVDIHERRTGVLQWVVLVDLDGRRAVGVYTWEKVYLSPVYRETLRALTGAGFAVATAVRGKDGIMKFLTGVSELEGVSFPEFRDHT